MKINLENNKSKTNIHTMNLKNDSDFDNIINNSNTDKVLQDLEDSIINIDDKNISSSNDSSNKKLYKKNKKK